jgi:hypothetical protein
VSRITPERVRALLAEWDTAVAGDDPEGCGTCAACQRWCLARAAMHAAAPDLAADLLDAHAALATERERAEAAEKALATLRTASRRYAAATDAFLADACAGEPEHAAALRALNAALARCP